MEAVIGDRSLEIWGDDCVENPWDCESRIFDVYHWHRRKNFCEDEVRVDGPDEIEVADEVLRIPLYTYEHSGVAYSSSPFGCPWDSGQCGVLVVTKARLEKMGCGDWDSERIAKDVDGWIETFSKWANGECYGFTLRIPGEDEESCGGFIGDDPKTNGMMDYIGQDNLDLVEALK